MTREAEELLGELENAKQSGHLILVEGKNDKKGFKELGFENVFAIDRMPLYRVVEEVMKRSKDVIIMTDLDKEGKKLYRYFHTHLTQRGVKVHNRLRNFMFKETNLKQMEGIVKYINRRGMP